MSANVGNIDRIARAVLGVILLILPFISGFGGLGTTISVIVGVVMLATSGMRFCPIYRLIGVNTCKL
ncbi:MAG: DUF2892 domain-containing protein [Mangrovicoccus sp.]|nr:DUF2892 domain-containing protein [Mangrovicoccus sp.]